MSHHPYDYHDQSGARRERIQPGSQPRAMALPARSLAQIQWSWKHGLVVLGLAAAAFCASLPVKAAALDEFRQFVTNTHSAQGTFSQQTTAQSADSSKPASVKMSSGTFVFARPGKFIWTYEKPYHQLLQSDGQKLYIYDNDLNQVTERKLDGALGSSPAAILFGSNDLEKNFTLKDDGDAEGLAWLSAVPKGQDMSFKKIRIGLKNGVLQKMELQDTFGKTSVLTLSGIVKNPSLPPDRFQFTVPQGADVYKN